MAKRQSTFDALMDISAKLPWWAGVLLAPAAYFGLHAAAGMEIAEPVGLTEIGAYTLRQVFKGFALFGQYLLPAALVLGAALSAYGRRQRRGALPPASRADGADVLQGMSRQDIARLVGEAFGRKGFAVRAADGGADGGADLALIAGRDSYLVQCAHWRATTVPVQAVRELHAAMAAQQASGGFVVSSGGFSEDAAAFARGRNIELLGPAELTALLQDGANGADPATPAALHSDSDTGGNPAVDAAAALAKVSPRCPVCGGSMVRRTARRGSIAGRGFWGCRAFPQCRGALAL